MADESLVKSITKFDGNNFQLWKFQIGTVFHASGIHDIVTGERTRPADLSSADGKAWTKDNAKAMCIISSAVEYSQLEYLITCKTASDMWNKLSLVHEQKSEANKLHLMKRFHDYRITTNDSVVHHIAKIQNIAAQLKDVGEVVSDVAVMAKILASLPEKFHSLVTAWDNVPSKDQNIERLQERLIAEERRITEMEDATSVLAAMSVSNSSRRKSQKPNADRVPGKFNCYACGKPGHLARNCWGKKKKKDTDEENDMAEDERSVSAFIITDSDVRVLEKSREGAAYKMIRMADVSEVWVSDSGASRHICYRREWFSELRGCREIQITLGDNKTYVAKEIGTILIKKFVNNKWEPGRIENVLYVPQLKKNLFSIGVCTTLGYEIRFSGEEVMIFNQNELSAKGIKQPNQIYRMLFVVVSGCQANISSIENAKRWHVRLGHLNIQTMKQLAQEGRIKGLNVTGLEKFFCEACQLGKSHQNTYRNRTEVREYEPGDIFHADVCGPMHIESLGGARYFLLLKDEASDFRYVFFLKHKSDVFERFKEFDTMVRNQRGKQIRVLRADRGTEFQNINMKTYLAKSGIVLETSAPYTPQQNGRIERDNRTIMESARSMLAKGNVPLSLWAEAVNTAVYVKNRATLNDRKKTPFEEWTGKKNQMIHLRAFGANAYLHIPNQFRRKLDVKAKKMVMVGYQDQSCNYRLYDPVKKQIVESKNVTFDEENNKVENKTEAQGLVDYRLLFEDVEDLHEPCGEVNEENHLQNVDSIQLEDACQNEPLQQQLPEERNQPLREGLRNRTQLKYPDRYQDFDLNYTECDVPHSFQEAVTGRDCEKWKQAIQEELKAHETSETWEIVPRHNQELIDSKWVFRVQSAGGESRYKARLCARGFTQRPGLDYGEIFSPVVRYDSLRILLAIAAAEDLELGQFDVKTAFLYGELEEDIHMLVPEGIEVKQCDGMKYVCKLKKSLYGLKQSPRCWNRKFVSFLSKFELVESDADKCVFYRKGCPDKLMLALFVDDGLLLGRNRTVLNDILESLGKEFNIKISDAQTFCGMEITRDRTSKSVYIHQATYTKMILRRFHMTDANAVAVPADPEVRLEKTRDCDTLIRFPFREAVGSLLFLATVSRPDISFATSAVSKYLNNFNESHCKAVKRIFKYLNGTRCYGLMYESEKNGLGFFSYSDSDYAGDTDTRRSTSGFVCMLAGGPITWSSQCQKMVTLSTTEAEYVAASVTVKDIIWIRKMLKDIGHQCCAATKLYIDNQSAIKLVKNPEYHKRTKHIDIRFHFIREKYDSGEICVLYVPSENQVADIFTKPLGKDRFIRLRTLLNIQLINTN